MQTKLIGRIHHASSTRARPSPRSRPRAPPCARWAARSLPAPQTVRPTTCSSFARAPGLEQAFWDFDCGLDPGSYCWALASCTGSASSRRATATAPHPLSSGASRLRTSTADTAAAQCVQGRIATPERGRIGPSPVACWDCSREKSQSTGGMNSDRGHEPRF